MKRLLIVAIGISIIFNCFNYIILEEVLGSTEPYEKMLIDPNYIGPDERIIWKKNYTGPIFTDSYYESVSTTYKFNGSDIEVGYADGNGNYYIHDFYILKNQTLIIEPGINVISIGPVFLNLSTGEINVEYPVNHLKIAGSIFAVGTEYEPINFIREYNRFDSFSIDQTEYNSRIEFNHCYFSNVDIYSTSFLFINNCVFQKWSSIVSPITHHYQDRGASEVSNSTFEHHCRIIFNERQKVTIENNFFIGDESGFAVANSEMTIQWNICEGGSVILTNDENKKHELTNNTFNNSYISLSGFLLIERNHFNGTAFSLDCEYGKINLKFNNISNSNLNYNDLIGNEAKFNFTNNYWGTIDEQKISFDLKVDEYEVEYIPYLDEEMNVFHELKEKNEKGNNRNAIFISIIVILLAIIVSALIIYFVKFRRR